MSSITASIPVPSARVLGMDSTSPRTASGCSSSEESSRCSNVGYKISLLDNSKVVIPRESLPPSPNNVSNRPLISNFAHPSCPTSLPSCQKESVRTKPRRFSNIYLKHGVHSKPISLGRSPVFPQRSSPSSFDTSKPKPIGGSVQATSTVNVFVVALPSIKLLRKRISVDLREFGLKRNKNVNIIISKTVRTCRVKRALRFIL